MEREDEGNLLSRAAFSSGATLFTFQLEPMFSHHGEYLTLAKTGSVKLEVQFATPLVGELFYLSNGMHNRPLVYSQN